MTPSDIVTLIGLVSGTVGAVLLAYDVIYRPGANWQANNFLVQYETFRKTRHFVQQKIKSYSQPPYTPQEIQAELDEEERKNSKEEAKYAAKAKEYIESYENQAAKFGVWGVKLIVVAFILQAIGLIIHSREETKAPTVVEKPPADNRLRTDAPRSIGPFRAGDDRGPVAEKTVELFAGELHAAMSKKPLRALLLVGSVDKQQLGGRLRTKFRSNEGLAEARAEWVEDRLRHLVSTLPPDVLILWSGPTIEAQSLAEKEHDRHVDIYAVWQEELPQSPGNDTRSNK
jgi:hypothetical protein